MAIVPISGIDWLQKEQANEDLIKAAADAGSGLVTFATDAETITGTSTTLALNPANLHAALKADAETITSASPATFRLIKAEVTLTPSSSLAVGSSGSIAGVRGMVTLTSGKSITGGFLFGAQGKITADGATIDVGSGHVAGLYGQMSASGATVTSGHVAVGILSGQSLPASANVDMLYAESGGNKINSVIKSNVKATYFLDISDFETAGICSATGTPGVCTGATGWIKVYVAGAVRYIPLSSSVS